MSCISAAADPGGIEDLWWPSCGVEAGGAAMRRPHGGVVEAGVVMRGIRVCRLAFARGALVEDHRWPGDGLDEELW